MNKNQKRISETKPIRDPKWINETRIKLLKFLKDSEFPQSWELSKLASLTAQDIRRFFEHICQTFDPGFVHGDLDGTWEDRILRVLRNTGYTGNLNKMHLLNPGIRSTVPIILDMLDHLSRISVVGAKVSARMLLPVVLDGGGSESGHMLESLADLYRTSDCGRISLEQRVFRLRDGLKYRMGIISEEEMRTHTALAAQQQLTVQHVLETRHTVQHKTRRLAEAEDVLQCGIRHCDEAQSRLEQEAKTVQNREEQLAEMQQLNQALQTKNQVLRNDGTMDIVKSAAAVEASIAETERNLNRVNLSLEKKRDKLRQIDNDVNSYRLRTLGDLGPVYGCLPEEESRSVRQAVQSCGVEDVLDAESVLHSSLDHAEVVMFRLIDLATQRLSRLHHTHQQQQELQETAQMSLCGLQEAERQLDEQLSTSRSCLGRLEMEQAQLRASTHQLTQDLKAAESLAVGLQRSTADATQSLQRARVQTEDHAGFYECDLELREFGAEVNVDFLQMGFRNYDEMASRRKNDLEQSSNMLTEPVFPELQQNDSTSS